MFESFSTTMCLSRMGGAKVAVKFLQNKMEDDKNE